MRVLSVDPKQKGSLAIKEFPIPVLEAGEVLIRIKTASLNHRDLYVNNEWKSAAEWEELIAGGDGAGIVEAVGENVTNWNIGDEVMVNPLLDDEETDSFPGFLGGPTHGTFATFVKVPATHVIKKPSMYTWEEAAAIPLALSTAWGTVMTKGKIQPGETVLIQGIGSGVALFILQLLNVIGAKAIVTSGSDEKIKRALQLGAIGGINYRTENVPEQVLELTNGNGVDVVIDSSGQESMHSSIKSLRKDGRLLVFGSTTGPFSRELLESVQTVSTGMVSQRELEEALHFYHENGLRPILSETIYSFEEYKGAYAELEQAKQFGKIVLRIGE